MFSIESKRIPRDAVEAITWLLDLDQEEKVSKLHLVREMDETGGLIVIKQYGEHLCKAYTTNLHISEVVGGTGEADLAYFTVMMELLYEVHSKHHDCWIKGHLSDIGKFRELIDGYIHPLNFLNEYAHDAPWWEDFWGEQSLKTKGYWEGWASFCKRFNESVDNYHPKLKAERDLIRNKTHPLLLSA